MPAAMPPAKTCWPWVLLAIDPSKGSVMKSGSITVPGMSLGVEKKPADAGPSRSRSRWL